MSDTESEPELPDLSLLRDQVVSSEQAVRHWEAELAAAVKEVQALDGFLMSTFTMLLGTRDQRIEEAVARVELYQRRIQAARLAVDEAKAAMAWADQKAADRASARDAHRVSLERVADRVRADGSADAQALAGLESSLAETRQRMEALTRVIGAVSGARAAAGRAARACDASLDSKRRDIMGVPFASLQSAHRLSEVHAAVAAWAERVPALESSLAAIGLRYDAGGDAAVPSMWGELLNDSWWADLRTLDRLGDLRSRFDQVHHELQLVLGPVEQERRELMARAERLEQERTALLERLS